MNRPARFAFSTCVLFALATAGLTVVMSRPSPPGAAPMADGFRTPILALELANDEEDLRFLKGEVARPLRAELQRIQAWDVYFPIAYAGMVVLFFVAFVLKGRKSAALGAIFALSIMFADWAENRVIDTILERLDALQSVGPLIPELMMTTWLKWMAIAASAGYFAVFVALQKRFITAAIAAVTPVIWLAIFLLGTPGVLVEIGVGATAGFLLSVAVTAVRHLLSSPMSSE